MINDNWYIYIYKYDVRLLDFLLINHGAGQTRKVFAKKTVLIGFPNIPEIRLTGKARMVVLGEEGGGGGVQRVHPQPGIILMMIIM